MTYHITTVNTIKEILNTMAASMTVHSFFLLPSHYAPFAVANLMHTTVTLYAVDRYYTYGDNVDMQLIQGRVKAFALTQSLF